jgi:hypothetical protein
MRNLVNRVRRAYAPPQLSGRPMLENIVQPLYSSVGLNNAALPSEVNLFQYAKGANVPGAGFWAGVASTSWHTNMETPSSLASPKVFTITGIRVHLSHLGASASNAPQRVTTADATSVTTGVDPIELAQVQDNLRVFNTGVLRLTVGPKTYAQHPLFFFPSNIGVQGLSDVANDASLSAGAAVHSRSIAATHQCGQYWDFMEYPVVIAAQQSFGVAINFPWGTNPTLAAPRCLTVFLDGILSREVS